MAGVFCLMEGQKRIPTPFAPFLDLALEDGLLANIRLIIMHGPLRDYPGRLTFAQIFV
jgi:hypothetical protein